MKNKLHKLLTVALATVSVFVISCEDDISGIGNSFSSTEVTISVDSLTYNLHASTIEAASFESRSAYNLLGSIDVPEYGALDCSFVTSFLPAETLNIPDSIKSENIDSVKMILTVPKAYISGDTLAPLQLKVYALNKELPKDISIDFNPEDYYDSSSPIAIKNYNLSGYSFTDSTFSSGSSVLIKTKLPVEFGQKLVGAYTTNPDIFIWPEEFAKYCPGIYVATSFGQGCIAPVRNTSIYAYYPKTVVSSVTDSDGKIVTESRQVADSVCLLTTAPEALSNVNILYRPSDKLKEMINEGKSIISTPCGHMVNFTFPAEDILDKYWDEQFDLGVINNMKFSISGKMIANSFNIGLPPALLMIKTSELGTFFSEGKLPDNVNSFTSIFSDENNTYTFNSMREYIVTLKEKGRGNIKAEDVAFTLLPVTVMTEEYTDPTTYKTIIAVTSVTPYIIMPSMVELDTENATVVFTYSNQTFD